MTTDPRAEHLIEAQATSTVDDVRPSRWPTALRALRHRNYRLFFVGQLISLCGTWMQSLAQAWLVYTLTHSSMALGAVGFAGQIPVFLLAPLGGTFADRHNRHRILIITQTCAMILALVLAALTITGVVQVWQIIAMASMLGMVNGFDIPTRQSFIVEMVGTEDLPNAIALNSSMFNSARMIGPSIAGLLVAAVGEGWCFAVNGASYLAVIASLLAMSVTPRVRPPRNGTVLAHILEGFGYAWRTRPVRALLLLIAMLSLVGMPYAVLMPVFAQQVLHRGSEGLGILMGAAGCGALLGAATLATRRGLGGLVQWIMRASLGFGISLVLFTLSRSFWLSAALLIPAGFSIMMCMAVANTLIQSMVPDDFRGRVMSVWAMTFMGMGPVGALLAGVAAHHFGAPDAVMGGGTVCILGALVFRWRMTALWKDVDHLVRSHVATPMKQ